MSNKYTGEVKLELEGDEHTLVFDWRALAAIQSEVGMEALGKIHVLNAVPAEVVAKILVCGLRKHHPDISVDYILDLSPPMIQILNVIDKGLAFAYFGPDHPKKVDKEEKASKKKTQ